MATGRDDFVIAFRSAFLKKKDKQKFSLLSLIFLSILIIILGNFNFKVVQIIKLSLNEFIYKAAFFVSIPENKIKKINFQIKEHTKLYTNYQNIKLELEELKKKKLFNNFLVLENEKLRNLINESISSEKILARVLIDKESPFLKSIVLNKGSKDGVKIGMALVDDTYLVGKVIEVNYTNSRALLLNDFNSKIPVILVPSGIQAVASGTGKNHGTIQYTKEEYKDEIRDREIVAYTSGIGGLFKPGLPVGKVNNDQINRINFFSDFRQLDYVQIVTYNIGDKN